MPADLGKLTCLHSGPEADIPAAHEGVLAAASAAADVSITDQDVAKKAVDDSADTPSVWFVNFPQKEAAEQKSLLAGYLQNVQDYRCWASLVWWRTVYSQKAVPQDNSPESKAARSAYCAKVATKHMRMTPWLAMNVDDNVSKNIECKVQDFHTDLIKAVLQGFVDVTPSILKSLEKILDSLRLSIKQSSSSGQSRTIVCERYEYIPQANVIKSYVRIISFSVTESIKNVQNAKKTESHVKCAIDYNNYEAVFNQKLWMEEAKNIEEEQKKAADDFRKKQTIDCDP